MLTCGLPPVRHPGEHLIMGDVPSHPRRSFLAWAVAGLGALFSAVLGAPVVAFVMDPRNRTGPSGDFRAVDGVTVRDLQPNVPVQGTLRSVRRDAWTLYPNDVIGRVWIILKKDNVDAAHLPMDDP